MTNNRIYIILVPSIGNMGGAQMYATNKLSYLKQQGWDVDIFYCSHYPILIDFLKEFENNIYPTLRYPPQILSKRKINEISNDVYEKLKGYKEVVFESHNLRMAYWGEIFAKLLNGKHIINPLDEVVYSPNKNLANFLLFKLERKELLNSSEESLKRFLGKFYKKEYLIFGHYLNPLCSNVLSDNDYDLNRFEKVDYNIICIGRLNKPYQLPTARSIMEYCKNSRHKFNIIYVGNSPDKDDFARIKNIYNKVENVNLYLLGYLYPIPRNLVEMCDIAISQSNSVLVSSELGIPTIAVDVIDLKPLGIYGKSTNNRFKRKDEEIVTLKKLLDDIIVNKLYKKGDNYSTEESFNIEEVFGEQLKFVEGSDKFHEYFEVKTIYPRFTRIMGNFIQYPFVENIYKSIIWLKNLIRRHN